MLLMEVFEITKEFPKDQCEEVSKLLNYMINNPIKFS